VRAGEAGGTLPATLDRLAGLLERERSLTSSMRAALICPAVLVVAAIRSIFLLLDYVLPRKTFGRKVTRALSPTRSILMIMPWVHMFH
jgi:type II secretory pathway component PulF